MPPYVTPQGRALLGGGGALLPFFDDFERDDGDLGNGWLYTAGKWTIAGGYAVGTPGLTPNLFLTPDFSADTNWFKDSGWTIAGGVGVKAPDAGNKGIRQVVATAGLWYRNVWTLVTRNAGSFWANFQSTPNLLRTAAATYIDTVRANGTSQGVEGDAASDGTIDDLSTQRITLADMFCVRDLRSANVTLSAPLVLTAQGVHAGLVACLDSITSPANFLIAHTNGVRAMLTKCVGGTYTQLINAAITYGDGAPPAIVKNGTAVSLYYNGAQVGTTQTVSDAGIISNTLHGHFSAGPEASFAELSAVNP